jgi:putative component of toxin-antitoxin plasmid stabilization module
VQEYRLDWGPGYRLYLSLDGDKLTILLISRTKQQQITNIKRTK